MPKPCLSWFGATALLCASSSFTIATDASGVLTSQVGYDLGEPMRAIVRAARVDFLGKEARFVVLEAGERAVSDGPLEYWGQTWGSHWWIADFSGLKSAGTYTLRIEDGRGGFHRSDPFDVGASILWSRCYRAIAFDALDQRARLSRSGKGWKDCGSDLQELSSHVVAVDALCDLIEEGRARLTAEERGRLEEGIVLGCGYLELLQDLARSAGLGDGPVVHEARQKDLVTGNVAKAAMIFARASRLLADSHRDEAGDYLSRAVKAFEWIKIKGPVVQGEEPKFFASVHGAPSGTGPPADQWMTCDLVMMARAAVELAKAGLPEYKAEAVRFAGMVLSRQVPAAAAEDGLHGHFYTYGDFASLGGTRFTEKAAIHCGAWSKDGRIYNKGGHYPHYLLPLIDMLRLWPEHPEAERWRECLRRFAFGYFLPACHRNPFLILPNGYYAGEGLLCFSVWYHGQNGIYSLAATMALEFERLFGDRRFREVAVGNLQWIAGLNCGLRDEESGSYLPISMIEGIGTRSCGGWSRIRGSVVNGFSAGKEFSISAPEAERDRPEFFHTEDYIAHSLPLAAALSRLESPRPSAAGAGSK